MNKTGLVVALLFAAGTAFGQLNPHPPSSTVDGVNIQNIGPNAGVAHWDNPAGLAAYKYASHADLTTPNMQSPDDVLGLSWNPTAPAALYGLKSMLKSNGGTIRAIFVGESAGWEDDFGYTRSGLAPGPNSYEAFTDINAVVPGNTVSFGDFFDVAVPAGMGNVFDFWFNASSSFSDEHPNPPVPGGGYYTFFDPSNSDPLLPQGPFRWSTTPLLVNTWDAASSTYVDIPTYLVGLEDWRMDMNPDMDFNDYLFGIQVLPTPVPEASTYGLLGAASLFALAALRRFRRTG